MGTKEAIVISLLNPNNVVPIVLALFSRNEIGISILLALNVPMYSIPLAQSSTKRDGTKKIIYA